MRSFSLFMLLTAALCAEAPAQCSPATQRVIGDGKLAEARAQMDARIKAAPNDDAAINCLGQVLMALDKAGEAERLFERAIKLNDKSSSHHLWLGNAIGDQAEKASKIKQPFMARRIKSEFERAVQLDPRNIEARLGLIQFYTLAPGVMGGSKMKAREQAAEIGRITPFRGHFAMAQIIEQERAGAREAEKEFRAAMDAAPDSLAVYWALGSYYQRANRWAESIAIYDRILAIAPSELLAHFQIGRSAAIGGIELERGERELKRWIASAPKDASVLTQAGAHHRLGMIYDKQGKKELARAEYEEAVRINPKHEEAKKALKKGK